MPENSEYHLLLSGPKAHRTQVIATCRQAGLRLVDGDPRHSWDHPDTTDGEDDPTVGWVTFLGDHPDRVPDERTLLGWVLRSHWLTPPAAPEFETVPAGTLERLDRLEQAMADRGAF